MAAFDPFRTLARPRLYALREVRVERGHVLYTGFSSKADEVCTTLGPIAWPTGEDQVVQ